MHLSHDDYDSLWRKPLHARLKITNNTYTSWVNSSLSFPLFFPSSLCHARACQSSWYRLSIRRVRAHERIYQLIAFFNSAERSRAQFVEPQSHKARYRRADEIIKRGVALAGKSTSFRVPDCQFVDDACAASVPPLGVFFFFFCASTCVVYGLSLSPVYSLINRPIGADVILRVALNRCYLDAVAI